MLQARFKTIQLGAWAVIALMLVTPALGAIEDNILSAFNQAENRLTTARDRARDARDALEETRDNVRAGVLLLAGDVRNFITESVGDLQTQIDEITAGRDAFIDDGGCCNGCTPAVCQPFKADMIALLQNFEAIFNSILTIAGLDDLAVDFEQEINLLNNAPGRALFPIYQVMEETNVLNSEMAQRLTEMADGLLVLAEIIDEPDVPAAFGAPGNDPLESRDPILNSELQACKLVLFEPGTTEVGPGGPRRAIKASRRVLAAAGGLKLFAKGLIGKGATRKVMVQAQIHGYIGVSLHNNRKKSVGNFLDGLADACLHIPTFLTLKTRNCVTLYTRNEVLKAVEANNTCTPSPDLDGDGDVDLIDWAMFEAQWMVSGPQ